MAAFAALGDEVGVERVEQPPDMWWQRDTESPSALGISAFDRHLDVHWRRASYSSITSATHEQRPAVASESEVDVMSDEVMPGPSSLLLAALAAENNVDEARYRAVPLGLSAMPGGTLVGTLVHRVLESVAFDAEDLVAEVDQVLRHELGYYNVDVGNRDEVVRGLCTAIESPLGSEVGLRLSDVKREDRLDELGFELPLAGGDDAMARQDNDLQVSDIASLLVQHLDPADPVYAYADRLRDPALGGSQLRGFLTGSIDLVVRLRDGRFLLADYKTNRLGAPDETLSAWNYRPGVIQAEMSAAHYPLQALLYSVALHRYLRWRQPDYEPARHLGGVLYLFLRGMSAVETTLFSEAPCGVWSWRPPAALVTALSDLFDQGVRR